MRWTRRHPRLAWGLLVAVLAMLFAGVRDAGMRGRIGDTPRVVVGALVVAAFVIPTVVVVFQRRRRTHP